MAELPLLFHIERSSDGYTSKMDSPSQGAKDIAITKTSFAGNELSLAMDILELATKED